MSFANVPRKKVWPWPPPPQYLWGQLRMSSSSLSGIQSLLLFDYFREMQRSPQQANRACVPFKAGWQLFALGFTPRAIPSRHRVSNMGLQGNRVSVKTFGCLAPGFDRNTLSLFGQHARFTCAFPSRPEAVELVVADRHPMAFSSCS